VIFDYQYDKEGIESFREKIEKKKEPLLREIVIFIKIKPEY